MSGDRREARHQSVVEQLGGDATLGDTQVVVVRRRDWASVRHHVRHPVSSGQLCRPRLFCLCVRVRACVRAGLPFLSLVTSEFAITNRASAGSGTATACSGEKSMRLALPSSPMSEIDWSILHACTRPAATTQCGVKRAMGPAWVRADGALRVGYARARGRVRLNRPGRGPTEWSGWGETGPGRGAHRVVRVGRDRARASPHVVREGRDKARANSVALVGRDGAREGQQCCPRAAREGQGEGRRRAARTRRCRHRQNARHGSRRRPDVSAQGQGSGMELRVVRKRECGDEGSQVRANQSPYIVRPGVAALPGCACQGAADAKWPGARSRPLPTSWTGPTPGNDVLAANHRFV